MILSEMRKPTLLSYLIATAILSCGPNGQEKENSTKLEENINGQNNNNINSKPLDKEVTKQQNILKYVKTDKERVDETAAAAQAASDVTQNMENPCIDVNSNKHPRKLSLLVNDSGELKRANDNPICTKGIILIEVTNSTTEIRKLQPLLEHQVFVEIEGINDNKPTYSQRIVDKTEIWKPKETKSIRIDIRKGKNERLNLETGKYSMNLLIFGQKIGPVEIYFGAGKDDPGSILSKRKK